MFTKKDLRKLIIPLIIEQLLAVLVGMVDVIMVAKVGESAVSGVSLVDTLSLLIIQLLAALATGGAVVAAQYIGAGKKKSAGIAANQLLICTFLLSIVIAAIALIFNQKLLSLLFGQIQAEVMDNAVIYFYLCALSYPFLGIYNACAALFRAMGNSRVSMKASLLMNGCNVIGNAICIFGLGMGVAGVGIPTLVSRAFAAILMLYLIAKPQNVLHVDFSGRPLFQKDMIARILYVGIPNGLENSMFQVGKIILQSLVATLGTATIAGFAVAGNLVTLEYLPGNALGLATITIIGQCIGAGEYQQAKKYERLLLRLNYCILAVLCSVIFFTAKPLVGIYNLSSEGTQIAVQLLLMHTAAMIFWPPAFAIPHALRAATDVKFTMIISIFSMWVFRIAGSYFLVVGLKTGVVGIWIAMFADWIVRDIFYLWRFYSNRWLNTAQNKSLI
ncbi:MAG: MATE family efflux transporter [Oscillospiraceae bacterium]|nr:MATE family efflux transporter [Oscillospiraceae bacterium]